MSEQPTPVPIPLTPPERGGRKDPEIARRAWAIGIAAVFVLGALAGCAILGFRVASRTFNEMLADGRIPTPPVLVPGGPMAGGEASVPTVASRPQLVWFGDDGYLAIQSTQAGKPHVSVWERETGSMTEIEDCVLVGVEKGYPRIYMTRQVDDGLYGGPYEGLQGGPLPDQHNDPFYESAWGQLASWSPKEGVVEYGETFGGPDIEWEPWVGPEDRTVEASFDAGNASAPMNMYFATGKNRVKANAFSFISCEPIGWSPSGRYFAVLTLASHFDSYFVGESSYLDETSLNSIMNRIVVYSTADGKPIYDVPLGRARPKSVSSAAMWDAASDVLYHQLLDAPPDAPFTEITAARLVQADFVTGKPVTKELKLPAGWRPGSWECLGTQKESARLVHFDGDKAVIWRLSRGGFAEEGTIDSADGIIDLAPTRESGLARLIESDEGIHCELSDRMLEPGISIWQESK